MIRAQLWMTPGLLNDGPGPHETVADLANSAYMRRRKATQLHATTCPMPECRPGRLSRRTQERGKERLDLH